MVLIRNGSTDGDKVLIPWKLEDRYAKTFRYNSAATLVAPKYVVYEEPRPEISGRKLRYYSALTPYQKYLMRKKSGACEICRSTIQLCVDHCHKTDVVRGILCSLCNSWLGVLESKRYDNDRRVRKISRKLERMGRTIKPLYDYLRTRTPQWG